MKVAMFLAVISGLLSSVCTLAVLIDLSLKDENFIFFQIANLLLGGEKPGSGAFRFPLGWLLILVFSFALGVVVAKLIFMYFKSRTSRP